MVEQRTGDNRAVLIRWLTAFLDTPRDDPADDRVAEFWCAVTGGTLSPWRGERFVTVIPADGDATLRLQRTDGGVPGAHLDLHVDDPAVTVSTLTGSGATVLQNRFDDVTVLRSPAGIVFCVVAADGAGTRPTPLVVDGVSSTLDQLCLDIPHEHYDAEVRWWEMATGWDLSNGSLPGFRVLERPAQVALRMLLQRIEEGPAGIHLDFSSSDRPVTVEQHVRLGATRVRDGAVWTVLADPAARLYCITDRDPATGRRPSRD
ncbi:VOC family protein [Nakamurella sp. A5-74]|uniref:VOC family protein n=1 Tax=Nakamurella sp. A5-74 TaxID=3158264 RepID=A0AAU8DM49_9ACTN